MKGWISFFHFSYHMEWERGREFDVKTQARMQFAVGATFAGTMMQL